MSTGVDPAEETRRPGQPLMAWFGGCPQLIMLDLDGTLIDSVADIALAVNRMRRHFGLPEIALTQIRQWVGRGAEVLLDKVMADAPSAFRGEASVCFAEAYREAVHVHTTLYPGVEDFLQQWQAICPLVCITNKAMQFTRPLLESLAMTRFFSLILAGDSFVEKKPHPRALLHALQYFSVEARQALMIGDSRNDILAAQAAGVRCIALNWGYNHGEPLEESSPDWIVNEIRELL